MEKRKLAFDEISRILAITRYDIEHHQTLNDQSLNIHGENWFRDIFNYVYGTKYKNANLFKVNFPAIDLIDETQKIVCQITTTKTKDKVFTTLEKIAKTKYNGYKIIMFFLLDKADFSENIEKKIKDKFNIEIKSVTKDWRDLIRNIESLETEQIIELNNKCFSINTKKYTDEIVLDLIFKQLLERKTRVKKDYNEDFGNKDLNDKIKLNLINERVASEIKKGSDYRQIMEDLTYSDNTLEDLRNFVINYLYKDILVDFLSKKMSKSELLGKKSSELQDIASYKNIDFSQIINKLHQSIEDEIEVKDFNAMNIAWIIISYFFEICDIGVDEKC